MTTDDVRPVPYEFPHPMSPAANAFAILGHWQRLARIAGWTKEQVDATLADAKSGDYIHLRSVIRATTVKR